MDEKSDLKSPFGRTDSAAPRRPEAHQNAGSAGGGFKNRILIYC